jgi:hypothetical protein
MPSDKPSSALFPYNSQLVSSFFAKFNLLHAAEFKSEDAFTLYHLVTEEQYGASQTGPLLPALGHAIAGGLASAVSKAAVYPIDTIVTRMQVQKQLKGRKEAPSAARDANAEYKSPIDAAKKIYQTEGGIQAFYAGLNSDVVKHIADAFLFFLVYSATKDRMLKRQGDKQLPVLKELSVGILAGAVSKAITQPISNIVVRQQTAALVAARDPTSIITPFGSRKLSAKDVALQIRTEKGIAGFWAGYGGQLILTLNPAITFVVDNLLRGLVPSNQRDSPPAQITFLIAAVSKVIATSITYPVMLAKSRAQAIGNDAPAPAHTYLSVRRTDDPKSRALQSLRRVTQLLDGQIRIFVGLRKIYREEGVAGLYAGLEGEVVKGFLQHGLTMMAKDGVHGGVIQLYYILLKLTKRWDTELARAQSLAKDAKLKVDGMASTTSKKVDGVASTTAKKVDEMASKTAAAARHAIGQEN